MPKLKTFELTTWLILWDAICITFAIWLAFSLRLAHFWPNRLEHNLFIFPLVVLISLFILKSLNVYRVHLKYSDFSVVKRIGIACVLALTISLTIWELSGIGSKALSVPRTSWVLICIFSFGLLSLSRLYLREFLDHQDMKDLNQASRSNVVIYGAGVAGVQLSRILSKSPTLRVIAFIDDNVNLQKQNINSLPVYPQSKISHLIKHHQLTSILLAIPSLTALKKHQLINDLSQFNLKVLTMPSLLELMSGKRQISELSEIKLGDLLGRDEVPLYNDMLSLCITDKVVMVTGAGGSIGSELCRQIIQHKPNALVILENNEYSLYKIEKELLDKTKDANTPIQIIPILGNVMHKKRMFRIMKHFKVQTLYHAAAYKHVPIVEYNMIEGIQNNIFGTLNTALAAIDANIEKFVLISTDKAVRPTNVMGASKRFAELILQSLASKQPFTWKEASYQNIQTKFCMVRFGNVLESSGSVVPLFRQQIRNGGPITVTHKEVTRYFMTIPEAAQLVIQAGSMGESGEVFLLEMGKPVRIYDLARKMIELSGYKIKDTEHPEGDIEIVFSGLRAGEKLYEELLVNQDKLKTSHPMIFYAQETPLQTETLFSYLHQLQVASYDFNFLEVRNLLLNSVKGYQPSTDICDHLTSNAPK